ncbi:SURP and G-patch domain-containing protein 1 [Nymphon striatum]|nr:SURP and G-patch domain-containing protein 1 [Nymphon striatum]
MASQRNHDKLEINRVLDLLDNSEDFSSESDSEDEDNMLLARIARRPDSDAEIDVQDDFSIDDSSQTILPEMYVISPCHDIVRIQKSHKILPVSPPEDTYILEAIEEAAKLIFSGECTEDELRSIKKSNVKFNFLYNADCDEYKCFQEKLKELKKQSEANVRRKRKSSRWDTPTETSAPENLSLPGDSSMGEDHVLPGVSSSKIEASSQCKQLFTDQGMNSYALQVFGTTNLSPEQWKQLEEQRKIRVLFEMVQAKKTAQSQSGKEKYEYDSDEDVEGGTWEHKRRAREMEKTKEEASQRTEMGQGKHHIGDFLPPDELTKFMEKYEALQEGRAPDLSDYKEFKLDESNVGYQMLMKLGWSEGQGLGVNESGIKDPVNKGNVAANNVGLGLEKPDEVASGDDEFQAYRKRMMLAYRFRPNPLVKQSKKAILLVMVIIYIM